MISSQWRLLFAWSGVAFALLFASSCSDSEGDAGDDGQAAFPSTGGTAAATAGDGAGGANAVTAAGIGGAAVTPGPEGASGQPPLPIDAGPSAPPPGDGGAATQPVDSGAPPDQTPRPTGEFCLNPGDGTYEEPGPYRVSRYDIDLSNGQPICPGMGTGMYTIFYPDPLEANCPHPIAVWGNGTGVVGSAVYEFFNRHAAAWGTVVAAAHDSNTGCGNYHNVGIDYLLAENQNPDSRFYGKLSDKAGTGGHSQGGMGATVGSAHPNVYAEGCVAGGGLVGQKVAFLCLTGTADMAQTACLATANRAPGPAFSASWEGGDHVGTETLAGYIVRDPGSLQMQRLYAAWFRCWLADDPVACAMFQGSPCGMCNEPGWATLEGRNM